MNREPSERPMASDELAALRAGVEGLEESQRTAIVLRFHEGMTLAEIAGLTGCAESTVHGRVRAALDRLPLQQAEILDRASSLVSPGGRLIYAVCTLFRAETDAIVDRFLAAHPDFQLMPTKEILGKARAVPLGGGERLRLLPHVHGTDGFFAAVLRRGGVPATEAGAVQT